MKEKRNLSGIYFRRQNAETKRWENLCFEDLPEAEQDVVLNDFTIDELKRTCKALATTLNNIGNELDISRQ